MADLDGLKAKLKMREGKPGFASNVEAIKAEIDHMDALTFTYRDNATGQFVSPEYALANPDTTRRVS